MELAVRIHVERLPEGVYLATSEEVPGLVAQGRTVAETLEIARDVARKLIEARREREPGLPLSAAPEQSDYTIVVARTLKAGGCQFARHAAGSQQIW
jgi:predicted RNase H-like HicB family nuclease